MCNKLARMHGKERNITKTEEHNLYGDEWLVYNKFKKFIASYASQIGRGEQVQRRNTSQTILQKEEHDKREEKSIK